MYEFFKCTDGSIATWQQGEIETYKHIKLMPIGPEISTFMSFDPVGSASPHPPGQAQVVVS